LDYSITEAQLMLQKEARRFLKNMCTEEFVREMEEDEFGFSPELWRKMADLDWIGLPFPEQYGGAGGSVLDLAILYEEMGRVMLPSPHLSTAILCGLTILEAGTEQQKTELLPRIIGGDLILALALSEPASCWEGKGWNAEGVNLQAKKESDHFIIDGSKLFVYDAHVANQLVCVTRTAGKNDAENGITLFLVDTTADGVTCTPQATTAGDKPNEVVFNNVNVTRDNIIGSLDSGWEPLSKSLKVGAILLCAEMVGAGQRALEIAVDYAKTRVQFEQPIGINQYVQEHCVNCLAYVDASRWMTYSAAWMLAEGLACDMEVASAKSWTSDAHEKVCWYAHQVLAGAGYMDDHGLLPLISRRGLAKRFYLGDSDFHLKTVLEQVKTWEAPKLPKGSRSGLWDNPPEQEVPAWEPWRERYEHIRKRKEERMQRLESSL
jgi:alkylation response protein AidB-like acyl-CoA dehydrogenase